MNALPDHIQETIEEMLSGLSLDRLSLFAKKLTEFYQQKRESLPEINTKEEHLAYLACRLPATYAALIDVFERIKEVRPQAAPRSLLDFGAGPATAFLAASTIFEELSSATLIERDPLFIELGKKLVPSHVIWQAKDLKNLESCHIEPADLVVLSYALGELGDASFSKVLELSFKKSNDLIVIVEPGTPRGYANIISARTQLLEMGGTVIAPCPHQSSCPLSQGDWCHFATRLPRSRLHRKVKDVSLGFEDEKFSYVVLSRNPVELSPYDRIIRPPSKHSGHLQVTLCTHSGTFCQKTISKRDGEAFRLAKKASWGDMLGTQQN